MSQLISPGVVTNGLSFIYDMGNRKSYAGEPTTNHVGNAASMSGWNPYDQGNDGTFLTEFGTTGYRMNARGSWNGISKGITIPSTGTYTLSAYIRYWGGSGNNNGATVYCSGYGGGDINVGIDKSLIGQWQRISLTLNATNLTFTFYIISYGGTVGIDNSTWEVTMPQVNSGSYATPFTNSSRSSTQALIDLTGVNTITTSSLTYDQNGTFRFNNNASGNYINAGNNSAVQHSSAITMEAMVKPNSATNLGNIMAKNGNNAYRFRLDGNNSNALWWYVSANEIMGGSAPNHMWSHCVVTGDSTGLKAYINGVQVASNSTAFTPSAPATGDLIIGALSSGVETFDGKIAIAKIYNRALSASEVIQNYNAVKEKFLGYQSNQTMFYVAQSDVTVTPVDDFSVNMFKNANSGGWGSQVYSNESFTAPCTIEFNKEADAGDNGVGYAMIGWNTDPTANNSYDTLDHAAYPFRTGGYEVYNNGGGALLQGSGVTWDSSKKLYVVYDTDGYIRHYNGDKLLYSANYGAGQTVYVDSAFNSVNSTYGGFKNIKVSRKSWNGTRYV